MSHAAPEPNYEHLPDPAERAASGLTDADVVRADIAATRTELAETVDALSVKLNVKARAEDKLSATVTDAKRKLTDSATRAKQSAPAPVQQALDSVGEKAAPHRTQIVAGLAAAAFLALVARRRRAARRRAGN